MIGAIGAAVVFYLCIERVEIPAEDRIKLVGWVIPAQSDSSGLWLLICHGNAGNLSEFDRPLHYAGLRQPGFPRGTAAACLRRHRSPRRSWSCGAATPTHSTSTRHDTSAASGNSSRHYYATPHPERSEGPSLLRSG